VVSLIAVATSLDIFHWRSRFEVLIMEGIHASVSWSRSNLGFFGLHVARICWTSPIMLGFDTSILEVIFLVREWAIYWGVKRTSSWLAGLYFKVRPC
jgi:hypothetical protein